MPFLDFSKLDLKDFRPGIKSWAHTGEHLIMAVMTIEDGMKDSGHSHAFDQSGLVLEGTFNLTIGDEQRSLKPGPGYFIPAEIHHAWTVTDGPVRIMDISSKIK
jgi:quercetin dioxygenase-like cupin family protein